MTNRRWTKNRVLNAIQVWHREGRLPTDIRTDNPTFERAARRHFGSWYHAQVAAGLTPPTRRKWTRESILQALRDRSVQGQPLTTVRQVDRSFCCSAARRFGSWQAALSAAGLQPYRRTWSKECVLAAIRSWHDKGLPLTKVWKDHENLYTTAKRFFGSWKQAVRAAGFVPTRSTWTRQAVIDALRARHEQGLSDTDLWRDHALSSAVHQYFGSRNRAREAAGLPTSTHRRWTRELVVKALRARQEQGLSLAQTWKEDRGLMAAAVRFHGSTHQALVAAGLEPNLRKWSARLVIQELRVCFPTGVEDRSVQREDQPLALAAKKYFGSWQDALSAAGIEPAPGRWSKEQVIEIIQDGWVQRRPLHVVGFGDRALARAAKVRFGGWEKAVAAAGLAGRYTQALANAGLAPTTETGRIPRNTA